jgi:hypothetical protein
MEGYSQAGASIARARWATTAATARPAAFIDLNSQKTMYLHLRRRDEQCVGVDVTGKVASGE